MFRAHPEEIPDLARIFIECRIVMRDRTDEAERELRVLGEQMAAHGRGILSLAFEMDAMPYAAITKLVREEDVPTLMARLPRSDDFGRGAEREQAIYDCLTAATGVKCELIGDERVKFWFDWWNQNAKRIVLGDDR